MAAAKKPAKKAAPRKPKATPAYEMGFAPPGPPTRMIIKGPQGTFDMPIAVVSDTVSHVPSPDTGKFIISETAELWWEDE